MAEMAASQSPAQESAAPPQEAAAPAPVTMMPLAVDTAAALQKEADLLAASQGNGKLLGYVTVSAGDFSWTIDRIKLSAWCVRIEPALTDATLLRLCTALISAASLKSSRAFANHAALASGDGP